MARFPAAMAARPPRPLPEVVRRLRQAFPEVWQRYETLLASRRDDAGAASGTRLGNGRTTSGSR